MADICKCFLYYDYRCYWECVAKRRRKQQQANVFARWFFFFIVKWHTHHRFWLYHYQPEYDGTMWVTKSGFFFLMLMALMMRDCIVNQKKRRLPHQPKPNRISNLKIFDWQEFFIWLGPRFCLVLSSSLLCFAKLLSNQMKTKKICNANRPLVNWVHNSNQIKKLKIWLSFDCGFFRPENTRFDSILSLLFLSHISFDHCFLGPRKT